MKNLILYFSATGNSLDVANVIGKHFKDSRIENIVHFKTDEDLSSYQTVGIIYPCYFLSTPKFILDKVSNLNLTKDHYIYGICTVNKYDGNSGQQLNNVLSKKGLKLSYYKSLIMVGNYVMMYNPAKMTRAEKLLYNAREKCEVIARDVKSKKSIPIKSQIKTISTIYYRVFESMKKKSSSMFQTNENCNGCGICSRVCPFDNIQMIDKIPIWEDKCEHCTACFHWCPNKAINYGNRTKFRRRYTNPSIKLKDLM